MPEPTDGLPTWATDGGTTLQPSSGQKAAGWSAGQRPPARWQNWWQNLVYQWITWFRGEPNGLLVWSGYIYSNDPDEVVVGPIAQLKIGGRQLSKDTETTLDTSAISDDGVFYIYAFDDDGSIGFEVTDEPLDTTLTFKNGGNTYRYIGCFLTDGSGDVYPFRSVRGVQRYRNAISSTDFLALSSGSATTETAVPLAAWMPPHARIAWVWAQETSSTVSASIGTNTASGSYLVPVSPGTSTGVFAIETNEDNEIVYICGNASVDLDIYMLGFEE